MTSCFELNLNEWFPVLVVFAAFLLSWIATISSGMSLRKRGILTHYTSVVGKSKFEPPGWVFGIVWFIIFVGYAALWVAVNQRVINSEKRNRANWLLGIGIVLNAAWSFFITFGAIGLIPVRIAHFLSTGVLFALGIYNIYLFVEIHNILLNHTDISEIWRSGYLSVLGLYIAWSFTAFFLSVTSPLS